MIFRGKFYLQLETQRVKFGNEKFAYSVEYAIISLSASSERKEVNIMEYLIAIVISVIADVIPHFVCKWIDRK